ncbi:hypothetical protein DAPPUDRAFT_310721 [Daphnia pulex]|uniref:Uncharacterized protein n=1 Tax=Daphnia pulex TaxID=6669 RepID=E9FVA5_DAPPU|nr:hypothetical protein DAPPUDRAFT_310721 [Daphnia pulex]|eukprot:EFX88527.1 hypothetical protein DAPPUDRAFT_310721 [Daphnia pulex]
MDRLKKCWEGILKEREDFWSSFFTKYQEDKKDVDFRSYMDNSSTRINTMLELAAEDKESGASKGSDNKVIQHFIEEQSSESSETYCNEVATSLNENQEQENLKPDEPSVISVKKTVPTLVLKAIPAKEMDAQYLLTRNSPNSVNKLISEESKSSNSTVLQYFEEQYSESSEIYSNEVATSLNENQEQENLKPDEPSVISVKKTVPTLVLKAIPAKEMDAQYLLTRNSPNSVNKLISEESKSSNSTVLQYFEEQYSESSEIYSNEVATPLNEEKEEQKVENLKPVQLPVVLVKKSVLRFALEVNPEKENAKCILSRKSHSPKKFISEALKGSDFKELQDLEEPSSDSSEPYSHEVTTPLNGDQEENKFEILKPVELPVVLMKRSVPTFVLEVNPKEEMAKSLLSRNSHSAKKFKLFDSSPHPKENVEDSIIDDQYQSFSISYKFNDT